MQRSQVFFDSNAFVAALFLDPRIKFSAADNVFTLEKKEQAIVIISITIFLKLLSHIFFSQQTHLLRVYAKRKTFPDSAGSSETPSTSSSATPSTSSQVASVASNVSPALRLLQERFGTGSTQNSCTEALVLRAKLRKFATDAKLPISENVDVFD